MGKKYRVTNLLYGNSKVVSADSSDAAKRTVLKGHKSSTYSHRQLMKHLTARQIPKVKPRKRRR